MGTGPITERYQSIAVGAGATVAFESDAIGGFLATIAGTLTITSNRNDGKPDTTLVTAYPIVEGWNRIPLFIGKNGGTVTSATCAGLLLVA